MKITILIGNGFDLRMGIASSFMSAKKHYESLEKKDPVLSAFQQSLKNDGEYWSDFELALGRYTSQFGDENQNAFISCLDDFSVELEKYLLSEEEKIDYPLCEEEIKKEFMRSLTQYDQELERKYRNELNSILISADRVAFQFISFNYTKILDKCLELSFNENNIVGSHIKNSARINHNIDSQIIHIHGSLPGPIIMGVDNESQIEQGKWSKQKRFLQRIAKPMMNARAGTLVDNEAANTINQSNIICIFGMSLGDTDKTWWKLIGQGLKAPDHRLIIFGHNSDFTGMELTHQKRFTLEDEIKDRFMDLAEIANADRSFIEDRIFVYINSSLFNINLVELTEQKKKIDGIEKEARKKELEAAFEKYQKISELTTTA